MTQSLLSIIVLMLAPLSVIKTEAHSSAKPTITMLQLDHQKCTITIHIPVTPPNVLYRDYITISIDHPSVTLSPWKPLQQSLRVYTKYFKKEKEVFTTDTQLTLEASTHMPQLPKKATLHATYLMSNYPTVLHITFPLAFNQSTSVTFGTAEATHVAGTTIPALHTTPNPTLLTAGDNGSCALQCFIIGMILVLTSALSLDTYLSICALLLGLLILWHVSTLFQ